MEHLVTAAQAANQVGLGTFLAVAMALFFGVFIIMVMKQNEKREERYAQLAEISIANLEKKIDSYKDIVKEKMQVIEEANRMVKQEHALMITSLQKTAETLIELVTILKFNVNGKSEATG